MKKQKGNKYTDSWFVKEAANLTPKPSDHFLYRIQSQMNKKSKKRTLLFWAYGVAASLVIVVSTTFSLRFQDQNLPQFVDIDPSLAHSYFVDYSQYLHSKDYQDLLEAYDSKTN